MLIWLLWGIFYYYNGFRGVFCEVIMQGSCCAKVLHTKWAGYYFLPHDEADGPGIQERDLRNSQMGGIPKSVLLHFAVNKISQKAR